MRCWKMSFHISPIPPRSLADASRSVSPETLSKMIGPIGLEGTKYSQSNADLIGPKINDRPKWPQTQMVSFELVTIKDDRPYRSKNE